MIIYNVQSLILQNETYESLFHRLTETENFFYLYLRDILIRFSDIFIETGARKLFSLHHSRLKLIGNKLGIKMV